MSSAAVPCERPGPAVRCLLSTLTAGESPPAAKGPRQFCSLPVAKKSIMPSAGRLSQYPAVVVDVRTNILDSLGQIVLTGTYFTYALVIALVIYFLGTWFLFRTQFWRFIRFSRITSWATDLGCFRDRVCLLFSFFFSPAVPPLSHGRIFLRGASIPTWPWPLSCNDAIPCRYCESDRYFVACFCGAVETRYDAR